MVSLPPSEHIAPAPWLPVQACAYPEPPELGYSLKCSQPAVVLYSCAGTNVVGSHIPPSLCRACPMSWAVHLPSSPMGHHHSSHGPVCDRLCPPVQPWPEPPPSPAPLVERSTGRLLAPTPPVLRSPTGVNPRRDRQWCSRLQCHNGGQRQVALWL